MQPFFSIIIPAYNRAHQLSHALAAYDLQAEIADGFEVIVVDDGSTDSTREVVESAMVSYPLHYFATGRRAGRSAARNLGAARATGRYLLFCDSDFLPTRDCLLHFQRRQLEHPDGIITGVPHCWRPIYTHYDPAFSVNEKKRMYRALKRTGLWDKRWLQKQTLVEVITPEDIRHAPDKVAQAVDWQRQRHAPEELAELMAGDVAPWTLFITRCVTVPATLFSEAGGFDEEFLSHGLEDWELGYRLHQLGVTPTPVGAEVGYHMEHPFRYRGFGPKWENYRKVLQKHGRNDPAWLLVAVVHPFVKPKLYKQTLRLLASPANAAEQRMTEALLQACRNLIQ